MALDSKTLKELLAARVKGPTFSPGDAEYAQEVAAFNLAVVHRPELVVGAESAEDITAVIEGARDHGYRVFVQGAAHGAYSPIESGVLITTKRINRVTIDAEKRIATIGAGARWQPVIAGAATHGLAPIAGASPDVGVVGYLLGGGLGPLARSHGFSSDYVASLALVTGRGERITASDTENPDVFWALRGGKVARVGIVTELELRLVPLPALYAGSLTFDTPHMEAAFRSWVDWTKSADPRVTTSVAFIRFPALDAVPEPLRGRHLMSLRFAYPGEATEGERLAAPLRAFARVYLDALDAMPAADVARIHNDPSEPAPSFVRGMLLTRIDQDFATALLGHAGAGTTSPIGVVELRQLGGATRNDVPGGSAVGGRSAAFALSLIGRNPAWFEQVLPDATDRLTAEIGAWVSPETNINYLGKARSPEHLASAWPPEIYERLMRIRERYDPLGLIGDVH
jgi:hypothetical protein